MSWDEKKMDDDTNGNCDTSGISKEHFWNTCPYKE